MQKHTPEAGAPWAERAADVLSKLEVSPQTGLTAAEVRRRRKQYGPNQMQEQQTQQTWQVFANQFKSIIVLILLGAAAASFGWGQMIDGAVISVAVLVNTLIGFVMEMRAIRLMESLRRMEQVTAKVIRNRDVREIPAGQLVPGDIVTLEGRRGGVDVILLSGELGREMQDHARISGPAVREPSPPTGPRPGSRVPSALATPQGCGCASR
jgi:P-type Ca2+ transporter type 2C